MSEQLGRAILQRHLPATTPFSFSHSSAFSHLDNGQSTTAQRPHRSPSTKLDTVSFASIGVIAKDIRRLLKKRPLSKSHLASWRAASWRAQREPGTSQNFLVSSAPSGITGPDWIGPLACPTTAQLWDPFQWLCSVHTARPRCVGSTCCNSSALL